MDDRRTDEHHQSINRNCFTIRPTLLCLYETFSLITALIFARSLERRVDPRDRRVCWWSSPTMTIENCTTNVIVMSKTSRYRYDIYTYSPIWCVHLNRYGEFISICTCVQIWWMFMCTDMVDIEVSRYTRVQICTTCNETPTIKRQDIWVGE